MKCATCFKELTSGDGDFMCRDCKLAAEQQHKSHAGIIQRYGWTCPKCGAVYAPFATECTRCNPPLLNSYTVTC
jgi:uncharacterized OB-fold protein